MRGVGRRSGVVENPVAYTPFEVEVRRIWPMSLKAKVTYSDGTNREYWAVAYPVPTGGFIVVVDLENLGRRSYYVESMSRILDALRQAVADSYILAYGKVPNFNIEVTEVLNSYRTYLGEVKEGTIHELPPLNDLHVE